MLGALALLVKFGLYTGVLGAVGFAIQRLVLGAEFGRLIAASALLLVICVAARLLLLNAELAGGLEHAFDVSMFGWIWSPNKAQTFAFLAGSAAIWISSLPRLRILVIPGAVTLIAGVGLGGHTQGLDSRGLSPLIASLHVAIAAFWITAPRALWPRREIGDVELSATLSRFSSIAVWAIPILFAGGVWLSLKLAGSVDALATTDYGRLLILKFALASLALSVGALNKIWVSKKIETGSLSGRVWLRRMLILDIFLFVAILVAIAAATTLTGPGS